MKQSFGKNEKLKSKKAIELLFSDGKSLAKFPVRLIYRKSEFDGDIMIRTAVSVSKRNFKKAVDRNRIKRLLREGYRKNKYIVADNTSHQFTFIFLYTGKEMPEYAFIESKIKGILQKFVKQELKPD